MPLSTRDRRASAGACGILALVTPPLPDGTISAGDCLQLLGMYRFSSEIAVVPGGEGGSETPIATLTDTQTPIATFFDVPGPVATLV